jgi:GDP-L-fucose synthase
MVGSAIIRLLNKRGHEIVESGMDFRTWEGACEPFKQRPTHMIMAAARVGGIQANMERPAEFIRDNLLIQAHLLHRAYEMGVRTLFLGSSCMYPRDCLQPMKEEYIGTGPLEPTNSAYAMAKLAGLEMVRSYRTQYGARFIAAIPCNIYGPGDHYQAQRAHVIPALLRRIFDASAEGLPSVTIWGTGQARRELMHADDLAEACLFLLDRYDAARPINVGTGSDISILQLAEMIANIIGYRGSVLVDPTHPDGMPRKLLHVGRINGLGWKARIGLREGLRETAAGLR